jgi:hypothetical protein
MNRVALINATTGNRPPLYLAIIDLRLNFFQGPNVFFAGVTQFLRRALQRFLKENTLLTVPKVRESFLAVRSFVVHTLNSGEDVWDAYPDHLVAEEMDRLALLVDRFVGTLVQQRCMDSIELDSHVFSYFLPMDGPRGLGFSVGEYCSRYRDNFYQCMEHLEHTFHLLREHVNALVVAHQGMVRVYGARVAMSHRQLGDLSVFESFSPELMQYL